MMARKKRTVRLPKRSRQIARDAIKSIGKAMYESYNGPCLIPSLPDDKFVEMNKMSGCHVIGERYLELIATNQRQVCTWNMNAHQMGNNAIFSEWDVANSGFTPKFEPFKPEKTSINSYLCKSKFACHHHDNKVFDAIDAPKTFDGQDPEHQFRLGLRAIAGTVANAEGVIAYGRALMDKLWNTPGTPKTYRSPALEKLDKTIQENGTTVEMVRAELREWQQIYMNRAERQIISCHMLARASVRVAISAVVYLETFPVVCTVLPRASEGPEDNLCDVILAIRNRQSKVHRSLKDAALKVKDLLESGPVTGLTGLVRDLSMAPTHFLFVSPEDYYNNDIISADDRFQIEREIASIANERMPR